jgi:hypothetical protein
LRAGDVAAVFVLSAVFVLACVLPLPRGDVRLQLQLGAATLQSGPWSIGPAAQLSWLFHAGVALVFRLGCWASGQPGVEGGVECLRGAYGLLVVSRLALLWLAFRRVSGSAGVAFAGLLVLLAFSLGRLPRLQPLLFGEACFAAVLFLLSRPGLTRFGVWGLGVLFTCWANCHESFVLGFVLLLLVLLARVVWLGQAVLFDLFARRLTGVLLMCAFLVLALNPRGPFLAETLWRLAGDPGFLALEAWQPLRFHYGPGAQWAFLLLWCLVVLTQNLAGKPYLPPQLLCILVFGFWPLWHQQILLFWLMVAVWCVMAVAPEAVSRCGPSWVSPSVPSFRKTVLAAVFVAVASTWFPPIHWLTGGRPAPLDRSLSQPR